MGICYHVEVHYPSYQNKGAPAIKGVFLPLITVVNEGLSMPFYNAFYRALLYFVGRHEHIHAALLNDLNGRQSTLVVMFSLCW